MIKLVFFVPESHLERVKRAVFDVGAGKIGDYEQCCWQIRGEGQFCPLPGSNPYLGEALTLEYADEFRVEMVCQEDQAKAAVAALRRTHPYEEPAFDVVRLCHDYD
ncbi:MAG: hypothetical protein ACI93R_000842 [Flavobacteriales bacterium]